MKKCITKSKSIGDKALEVIKLARVYYCEINKLKDSNDKMVQVLENELQFKINEIIKE